MRVCRGKSRVFEIHSINKSPPIEMKTLTAPLTSLIMIYDNPNQMQAHSYISFLVSYTSSLVLEKQCHMQ